VIGHITRFCYGVYMWMYTIKIGIAFIIFRKAGRVCTRLIHNITSGAYNFVTGKFCHGCSISEYQENEKASHNISILELFIVHFC
jgi:hypothetical protein